MATVNSNSPGVQGFQTTYSGDLGEASKWVWMRTQLVFVQSAMTGPLPCRARRTVACTCTREHVG